MALLCAVGSFAQTVTILYSFVSSPVAGDAPYADLVQGSDGNFYGTTNRGGTSDRGTVFRISSSGSYTNLYSFVGYPVDGSNPYAGLVQGSDGNFYGTTYYGGTYGAGTVFRISSSGSYTNLYSFVGYPDGSNPYAGLVQGSDGNFYGTTFYGGTYEAGTVFRISSSGTYSNLYSFGFGGFSVDGRGPSAGLVQGSDGSFYGTTYYDGTYGAGTVFRISSSGSYTNLYFFGGFPDDGRGPSAGLVQGSDGNLYGTTEGGGTYLYGTVFRISPSGNYTNLYPFVGYPDDGRIPEAGLVQGSDGDFYGTTRVGGASNYGTVFRLTVPLGSPHNQISAIELVGTDVVVSLPSVAGETYQLQTRLAMTSGDWSNVPNAAVTNSLGGMLMITNSNGASQSEGFYRFLIRLGAGPPP